MKIDSSFYCEKEEEVHIGFISCIHVGMMLYLVFLLFNRAQSLRRCVCVCVCVCVFMHVRASVCVRRVIKKGRIEDGVYDEIQFNNHLSGLNEVVLRYL